MRLYNFITPEMIEDTRRSGDHLWLYNLASGGRNARIDRFVFGQFTERCGAEGCAQWAYQWPNGNTNPYEAAAATGSSGYHYALPAPDGPLPTLALEGVREGIDDARYLALLPKDAQGRALEGDRAGEHDHRRASEWPHGQPLRHPAMARGERGPKGGKVAAWLNSRSRRL